MRLHEYSVVFMAATGICALIVASPALSRLLVVSRTEFFTEMWILGPAHKAEGYPFNVTRPNNYKVFLGIGNQLGHCAYYLVEVKFRNQNQSAPNNFNRTSSSLPSLFNVTTFVADEGVWELPLTFSFDYGYNEALRLIEFHNLILNDVVLDINNRTITWDSDRQGFFGNLFFELWQYNITSQSFEYTNRFIGIWLNMTV
jgi:uncharacterized membrane protein